jgi:5-methyltetrahydrofolate--homocysteine methyltransferase
MPELYTEGYPYFVRGRDSLRTHASTLFQSQIVLYDGAMIQNYAKRNKLDDEELRGDRFMNWTCNVKGKNDMLSISQSQVIQEIYRQYLEIGGSNIIGPNTFSYTTIAMDDMQP